MCVLVTMISVPATSAVRFSTPAPPWCTHLRARERVAPSRRGRNPKMTSASGASSCHVARSRTRRTRTRGSTASISLMYCGPRLCSTATTHARAPAVSGGIARHLAKTADHELPVERRQQPPGLGPRILAEKGLIDRATGFAGREPYFGSKLVEPRVQFLAGPRHGAARDAATLISWNARRMPRGRSAIRRHGHGGARPRLQRVGHPGEIAALPRGQQAR